MILKDVNVKLVLGGNYVSYLLMIVGEKQIIVKMVKNVKNSVVVYVKLHFLEKHVKPNKIIGVLSLKIQRNVLKKELVIKKKDVSVKMATLEKIVNSKSKLVQKIKSLVMVLVSAIRQKDVFVKDLSKETNVKQA